jgi:hypothetical protein
MELSNYDGPGNEKRATQVDTRLPACGLPANRNLSGRGIHVDPAALLMPLSGIIRQGVFPGLVERMPDHRMTLQLSSRGR